MLSLARAATATKCKRNARFAAAAAVSGTRKDGEEEGKAARSRPAGELWRRLSRGRGTAPATTISSAGSQPQVVVAA